MPGAYGSPQHLGLRFWESEIGSRAEPRAGPDPQSRPSDSPGEAVTPLLPKPKWSLAGDPLHQQAHRDRGARRSKTGYGAPWAAWTSYLCVHTVLRDGNPLQTYSNGRNSAKAGPIDAKFLSSVERDETFPKSPPTASGAPGGPR